MADILIVDDDPGIRETLSFQLKKAGHAAAIATNGEEGLALALASPPDLVITDLRMPKMEGQALIDHLHARLPSLPVVVMTAYASVKTAVEAMKSGAVDFLIKPYPQEVMLATVERALTLAQIKEENRRLKQQLGEERDLLVLSAPMKQVMEETKAVADTDLTVLITGESGAGKEGVARALHAHSGRDGELVIVNCGALPEHLVEAELFGHTAGAFTGAQGAREGRIAKSDGGTLFLDEIGDLPLATQVKLLRFLQEGEITPVGSDKGRKVNVRVVAATHRDLEAMVGSGDFREDLFYRLSALPLHVPPLRRRTEEIAPLARRFLEEAAQSYGRQPAILSEAACAALEGYPWPGNVRELRNLCNRWAVLRPGQTLSPPLPGLQPSSTPTASSPWQLPAEGIDLADLEKRLIEQALEKTGGNKSAAARLLGLTRHTLDYRMEKHGV
ncbi:MAG: DNA-binding response regulator [Alphaproteobacteria bacterium CG_4_10_14_0_2_um_filter_63_37]|nr:MAG: hypothetical protein AUJ55_09920 [Proteobacteria bacterium CG1_02_64_396]PJA25402.1 MAG: DNA-binding response regulator [Alphaproteobacteria bacterium CG_4_10_14_0_2_um_filter_63_37]